MSNVVIDPFIVFPAGGFSSPLDHGAALLFWWDADQGITLGTSPDINTWTDQDTGIDADFVSNPPHLEDPSLNSLPGVDYDIGSGSTRLVASAVTAINNIWTKGSETTLWIVFQWDSQSADGYFLDKGWNSSNGWAFRPRGAGDFQWRQRASGGDVQLDTSNTFSTGAAYYLQLTWDGNMANDPVLKVDGSTEAWGGSSGSSGSPDSDTSADMVIGNRNPGGGNPVLGRLHEIYATVDSSVDPSEDETYITNRWGL